MGIAKQHDVIDETFAGLSEPAEVHRIGRPDIHEDRPGDILVGAVREFKKEGGFDAIVEARAAEREMVEAADAKRAAESKAQPLPDFGVRLPTEPGKAPETALKDSSEDE